MSQTHYQAACFMLSVARLDQLPVDRGREVAFAGRSNVGKSSVLNQLTNHKKLARVSKTPGRTQLLNFFSLDVNHRLVDLPGYGYARVPLHVRSEWAQLIEAYLKQRKSLRGLVLVMDARHPLQPLDLQFLSWSQEKDYFVHILLNKADKLSQNEKRTVCQHVLQVLISYNNKMSVQLFSATKGEGMVELEKVLDKWFAWGDNAKFAR